MKKVQDGDEEMANVEEARQRKGRKLGGCRFKGARLPPSTSGSRAGEGA